MVVQVPPHTCAHARKRDNQRSPPRPSPSELDHDAGELAAMRQHYADQGAARPHQPGDADPLRDGLAVGALSRPTVWPDPTLRPPRAPEPCRLGVHDPPSVRSPAARGCSGDQDVTPQRLATGIRSLPLSPPTNKEPLE